MENHRPIAVDNVAQTTIIAGDAGDQACLGPLCCRVHRCIFNPDHRLHVQRRDRDGSGYRQGRRAGY